MREVSIRLVMRVPDDMTDDKAVELLNSVIISGEDKAKESVNYDHVVDDDARLIVELYIGTPEIAL